MCTTIDMKKTVTLRHETWKKLHNLRINFDFDNLDDTVYIALSVLEIVGELARKYGEDIVSTTRDMVLWYNEYLESRFKLKKGGL